MRRFAAFFLAAVLVVQGIGFDSLTVKADEIDGNQNEQLMPPAEAEGTGESHTESEGDEEGLQQGTNEEITEDVDDPVSDEKENPVIEDSGEESLERENSWRYSNGQPKENANGENGRKRSARTPYPNVTKKGIDVSKWQGVIDWEAVKASGIDFAIIRCGYGKDTTSRDDEYWLRNVSECERLGIPYGVYLYSYATTTADAMEEAKHVLRLINGRNLAYPVYYDMEDETTIGCDLESIARTFCSTIQNAGYPVGVYASTSWWNTYLTGASFSLWHRWVAEWGPTCNYRSTYAVWQYSSDGAVPGISGRVDMNYLIGHPDNHGSSQMVIVPDKLKDIIGYSAHIQDIGWQNQMNNGIIAGTIGSEKHMEAFKIDSRLGSGSVQYQSYVQGSGWQDYVSVGEISGTTGKNKYIEAVRIKLSDEMAGQYDVYYRVCLGGNKWLDWAKNGAAAGTIGDCNYIGAIQIALLSKGSGAPGATTNPFEYYNPDIIVGYQTHVRDIGWQDPVGNGQTAGTVGKALGVEALSVLTDIEGVGIKYSSYVQGEGWQDYVQDGTISGTTGRARSIEAVKVELTGGNKDNYSIYYRAHISNLGWLGWAESGQEAGSRNYGYEMEALQVLVLPKGSEYAPTAGEAMRVGKIDIAYQAHVRDIGWQQAVSNGTTAGTTGRALSIEALAIDLKGTSSSQITIKTHVQNIGWQNWQSGGQIGGTVGQALPMEAIKIKLKSGMEKTYDVYYRVHSRDYGWLGWAKNGQTAGTQGCAKPMEAIEIVLVEKGGTFAEYNASEAPNIIR